MEALFWVRGGDTQGGDDHLFIQAKETTPYADDYFPRPETNG